MRNASRATRRNYALRLLAKNPKLSDEDLNRNMKAKFGHGFQRRTADTLREKAAELQTPAQTNSSWKDENTMAAKKPAKKTVEQSIIDLGGDMTTTGEVEIKELAMEIMKVMENTSIVSVNISEDGGRFKLTLGIKKIEKRQVQLEPRTEV